MDQNASSTEPAMRDQLERLPAEIRENIITFLGLKRDVDRLCEASPIISQDRQVSSLLVCWDSLAEKFAIFGDDVKKSLTRAHKRLSVRNKGVSWYYRPVPDPLFSERSTLVFQMDTLYRRMVDSLNVGPETVTKAIKKHSYAGDFPSDAAKKYGEQGQRFPTSFESFKILKAYEREEIFSFLLLVDLMDDLSPSYLATGGNWGPHPTSDEANAWNFAYGLLRDFSWRIKFDFDSAERRRVLEEREKLWLKKMEEQEKEEEEELVCWFGDSN